MKGACTNHLHTPSIVLTIHSGSAIASRSYSSGAYKYGFNGKEEENGLNGSGNAHDFGARIYDSRLGRWLAVDPLRAKFSSYSPYNFAVNSPVTLIDEVGEEPDLNRSGTIQEAIAQWRTALDNLSGTDIANWIREGGKVDGAEKIRYVYTEDKGWIDLYHYFKTDALGETIMDAAEPMQKYDQDNSGVTADGGHSSTYSYEDLPSNKFGAEADLHETKVIGTGKVV